MTKPFAYIGLVNPKSPENVGMVMRAAGCYEVSKVFYTGINAIAHLQLQTSLAPPALSPG